MRAKVIAATGCMSQKLINFSCVINSRPPKKSKIFRSTVLSNPRCRILKGRVASKKIGHLFKIGWITRLKKGEKIVRRLREVWKSNKWKNAASNLKSPNTTCFQENPQKLWMAWEVRPLYMKELAASKEKSMKTCKDWEYKTRFRKRILHFSRKLMKSLRKSYNSNSTIHLCRKIILKRIFQPTISLAYQFKNVSIRMPLIDLSATSSKLCMRTLIWLHEAILWKCRTISNFSPTFLSLANGLVRTLTCSTEISKTSTSVKMHSSKNSKKIGKKLPISLEMALNVHLSLR